MIPHEQHTIQGNGLRLDRFLRNTYPWLDRATILELIAGGNITRGGSRLSKGRKLSDGDVLDCRDIPDPEDLNLRPNPDLPLTVLFEDESLLALNKPAGQPTHPLRHTETDALANALIARYPALADVGGERLFPALLHRLDTQTSGLVLAAKTNEAYAALRSQFRQFTVEKHYTALVHGCVKTMGFCDAPLTHQTRSPCKMAIVTDPANVPASDCFAAQTSWTPIETGPDRTLLDVTIFSGVTHQIRCHLAAAGHPIVGDALYGSSFTVHRSSFASRHWLHASRIRCAHPATGEPLDLACPLPPNWPSTLP